MLIVATERGVSININKRKNQFARNRERRARHPNSAGENWHLRAHYVLEMSIYGALNLRAGDAKIAHDGRVGDRRRFSLKTGSLWLVTINEQMLSHRMRGSMQAAFDLRLNEMLFDNISGFARKNPVGSSQTE